MTLAMLKRSERSAGKSERPGESLGLARGPKKENMTDRQTNKLSERGENLGTVYRGGLGLTG